MKLDATFWDILILVGLHTVEYIDVGLKVTTDLKHVTQTLCRHRNTKW